MVAEKKKKHRDIIRKGTKNVFMHIHRIFYAHLQNWSSTDHISKNIL